VIFLISLGLQRGCGSGTSTAPQGCIWLSCLGGFSRGLLSILLPYCTALPENLNPNSSSQPPPPPPSSSAITYSLERTRKEETSGIHSIPWHQLGSSPDFSAATLHLSSFLSLLLPALLLTSNRTRAAPRDTRRPQKSAIGQSRRGLPYLTTVSLVLFSSFSLP